MNRTKSGMNEAFDKNMKKMYRDNNKIFRDERNSLLREYKKSLDEINTKISSMGNLSDIEKGRLRQLRGSIKEIMSKLNKDSSHKIKSLLKTVLKNAYDFTGYNMETTTGLNLGFGLIREESVLASIRNPLDKIGWLRRNAVNNIDIKNRLQSKITQAITQGKSIPEVSKDISKLMNIAGYKATRIARTETRRVQSIGTKMAMKETNAVSKDLGITTKRFWIATLDNKTRDVHGDFDGVEEDENGMFNASGFSVEAPTMFGEPEQDINCRCTVGITVDNEKPSLRRDNEDGKIISYKTFNEWKDSK